MARPCHVPGCKSEVLSFLASDSVCLQHFVELVIERAERIRSSYFESRPVDQKTIDWLMGDALHVAQVLSASAATQDNEQILELLLCLANLQDYVKHHSMCMTKPN